MIVLSENKTWRIRRKSYFAGAPGSIYFFVLSRKSYDPRD